MKVETTPIPPYLLFSRRTRPIDRLRWKLIPAKWRQMGTLPRKLGFIGTVLGWPAIAAWFTRQELARHGQAVREMTGKPRWKQAVEQYALAVWYGTPPHAYYTYDLFLDENLRRAPEYFHNQESNTLTNAFNKTMDRSSIDDKIKFQHRCQEAGIPAIPVLAVFEQGELVAGPLFAGSRLPAIDLLSKPANTNQGEGILAWQYLSAGKYQGKERKIVTVDQLLSILKEKSRYKRYLLQPLIRNHPSIRDISPGGLCTARIFTARSASGEIMLVDSVFRIPYNNTVTDNFSTGGLVCPVDPETGQLGMAARKIPESKRHSTHPHTGQPIEGVVLPYWDQAKGVCMEAHGTFRDYVFVGWDVAITEDQALLVEANSTPGHKVLQKGNEVPMNKSFLNQLCLEYFELE